MPLALQKIRIRAIHLFISSLLLLSSCNFPIPNTFTVRQFADITSPHDGDIISASLVTVNLNITTLGGGAQSLLLEQTSPVSANNRTYGPFALSSSANQQDIVIPNVGHNNTMDIINGVITLKGIVTMRNGSTFSTPPITICMTYFNTSRSSQIPDLGYEVFENNYCIPKLLPDTSTLEYARQIYVESAMQFLGDRCYPNNSGLGLILDIYAQTTATHNVSRVTAEVRYFGDPSIATDVTRATADMQRIGESDYWTHAFIAQTSETPGSLIPPEYTSVEVVVRAYNLEEVERASDTTIFSIPPCISTGDQKENPPTVTPASTPTQTPLPVPTKKKREDEPQEPADPATSCPPTIFCG
ncbi:MAG: hypothetical protein JNM55_22875 [Anaerolineales bacterium]|nr:hypothetical protein [Anaerolineales bacterium]